MTERFDSVIVGAGPGGSTAARELALAGARVLLLDKASFPRDKPCGGGVLISATDKLPFSLEPVSERVITRFRIRFGRGEEFEHRYDRPLALMTQRSRLDAYLAEQAVVNGAEFRDGQSVRSVEANGEPNGVVSVRLGSGDVVRADVLIAADGANSVVRRTLGLEPLRAAVALEANAPDVPDRWADAVGLELGSLPGGYGWVFPKGDHCNLGVGGWPVAGPSLRGELDAYTDSEGFDAGALFAHRGHHLPLRDPNSTLVAGRVAFIGDAAGLVDPLSGEGIGNAIHSGSLAAAAAGDLLAGRSPDLSAYARAIEREIEPELAVARQLQALFHQQPWPYVQLLRRSSRFWTAFCRMVRGEGSYTAFKGRLGPGGGVVDLLAAWATRGMLRRSGWGSFR